MIEIFNAVSNIAKRVKLEVLDASSELIDQHSDDINKHCEMIIEKEFEWVRSVKGIIGKDKKQYCLSHPKGKYFVTFVAIDNTDLMQFNYSIGTIFGVYEHELDVQHLKAAIYIAYGPTVQIVYASKNERVKLFTMEHNEFIQKDELELKEKGKINSCSGNAANWGDEHKSKIEAFFANGYRLRMSDSLALDAHQILLKGGGIFSNPENHFEHLFEAFPISFIITLAGGKATDGKNDMLSVETFDLHSKTPLYFGSIEEMKHFS